MCFSLHRVAVEGLAQRPPAEAEVAGALAMAWERRNQLAFLEGYLGVEDVDVFVPHQANRRIIDHAARRLGLDEARVFSNVDRYDNTSAG